MVEDALLATVSHPAFKMKPILTGKKDALKQELIAAANNKSIESESKSDHNRTKDNFFHWSDGNEKPATSNLHNHTSIEVLQYLQDSNSSLESLYEFPESQKGLYKINTELTVLRLHQ